MSGNNHTDVLLEDINSKFDILIEAMGSVRDEMKTVAKQEGLDEVKIDIKIVKAAVTDFSSQVQDHETRITKLESV